MEEKKSFKSDGVFILSAREYKSLKNAIPLTGEDWILGSDGNFLDVVSYVGEDGFMWADIDFNTNREYGIRPAFNLKLIPREVLENHNIDFTLLPNDLAIARNCITKTNFIDGPTDYENSYLRSWCLNLRTQINLARMMPSAGRSDYPGNPKRKQQDNER